MNGAPECVRSFPFYNLHPLEELRVYIISAQRTSFAHDSTELSVNGSVVCDGGFHLNEHKAMVMVGETDYWHINNRGNDWHI